MTSEQQNLTLIALTVGITLTLLVVYAALGSGAALGISLRSGLAIGIIFAPCSLLVLFRSWDALMTTLSALTAAWSWYWCCQLLNSIAHGGRIQSDPLYGVLVPDYWWNGYLFQGIVFAIFLGVAGWRAWRWWIEGE